MARYNNFEEVKEARKNKTKFNTFAEIKKSRGFPLSPTELRSDPYKAQIEAMEKGRLQGVDYSKNLERERNLSKLNNEPAVKDFMENNPEYDYDPKLEAFNKGATTRSIKQIIDEYNYEPTKKNPINLGETELKSYDDTVNTTQKIKDSISQFNRNITGNDGIPEAREKMLERSELLYIPKDYNMESKADYVKAKFRLGQLSDLSGREWSKKAAGVDNIAEDVDRAMMEMMEQYPELQDPNKGWIIEGVGGAAEMLPTQINAQIEGAKKGLPAGLSAGGAAIALGQAGPQIAIPEEIITGPAAFGAAYKAGAGAGAAEYMFNIEKGNSYRELLENGVDPERANKISTAVGLFNGGVEMAQIGTFLKSFKSASEILQNPLFKKQLNNQGIKLLGNYLKNVASETGQEVVQEAGTIAGTAYGTGENPLNEENFDRLVDTALQSAKAFSVMMAAGPGANAANMTFKQFQARSQDLTNKVDQMEKQIKQNDDEVDPMKIGELENTLNEIRTNADNNQIKSWANETYNRITQMKEENDINYKQQETVETKEQSQDVKMDQPNNKNDGSKKLEAVEVNPSNNLYSVNVNDVVFSNDVDPEIVERYKTQIREGQELEPIEVVDDNYENIDGEYYKGDDLIFNAEGKEGQVFISEDGNHRLQAYKELGYDKIDVNIRHKSVLDNINIKKSDNNNVEVNKTKKLSVKPETTEPNISDLANKNKIAYLVKKFREGDFSESSEPQYRAETGGEDYLNYIEDWANNIKKVLDQNPEDVKKGVYDKSLEKYENLVALTQYMRENAEKEAKEKAKAQERVRAEGLSVVESEKSKKPPIQALFKRYEESGDEALASIADDLKTHNYSIEERFTFADMLGNKYGDKTFEIVDELLFEHDVALYDTNPVKLLQDTLKELEVEDRRGAIREVTNTTDNKPIETNRKKDLIIKPKDSELASNPDLKYNKADAKLFETMDQMIPDQVTEKMNYNVEQIITNNQYEPGPLRNRELKPIHEIIKDIGRDFKIGITSSRFRGSGYAHYKPFPKVIETSVENTIGPITHELGHHLDDKYKFSTKEEFKPMINQMISKMPSEFKDQYDKNELKFEAMAEFLRLYMTSPADLIEYGGDFTSKFLDTVSEADLTKLNNRRDEVLTWLNSNMREQINSHIISRMDNTLFSRVVSRAKENFKETLQDTTSELKMKSYMFFVDNLKPLEDLVDFVEDMRGKPLRPEDNFYLLADHAKHSSMIAKAITTDQMLDPDGNIIGEGFKSVLEGINEGEYEDFTNFLVLRRALDYMGRGKRVFSDDISAQFIQQELNSYMEEKPHFVRNADKLYKWWGTFGQAWLVDTGLVDQELYNKMQELEPHYVPFFRSQDDYAVINGRVAQLARRGYTDHRSPLKRSSEKGSAKPVLDPIESIIIEIERFVTTVKRRDVMLAIHDMYEEMSTEQNDEGIGWLINRVNPGMEASEVNITDRKMSTVAKLLKSFSKNAKDTQLNELLKEQRFVEALQRAEALGFEGNKIIEETLEDIVIDFKPMEFDKEANIVSIKGRDNKTYHYEIQDKYLLEALLSMDTSNIDGLTRSVAAFRRVMQSLITTFDPMFLLRNISRDTLQGAVASNMKLRSYPKQLAAALIDEIKGGEWSKAYKQMGGGYASPTGADRDALAEAKAAVIPGWKSEHKLQSVLQTIERFSDAIEQAPRIAEYKAYLEENGDTPANRLKAMYEAQDVTVNFSRKGQLMQRWYGQWIPFLNAAIQGLDKFRRLNPGVKAIKGDKKARSRLFRTASRAFATVTLLQLAQMAMFKDDEEYDKISNYIKDNYWILPTPTEGKYIRIPKPREIAVLYGSSFERAFNSIIEDEGIDAWDDFSDTLIQNFMPPLRTIAAPMFDVKANETWYGGDIIPYAYKDLQIDEQYDRNTSLIARTLAKAIPDSSEYSSPFAIDYLLKQYTGVVGKMIVPMTDDIKGNALETPKRAFSTDTAYSNNDVRKFYDRLSQLDAARNTARRRGRLKGYYDQSVHDFYKTSSDAIRKLYDLQDQLDEIKTLPKNEQEEMFEELLDGKEIPEVENLEALQRRIQYTIRDISEKANEIYDNAKQGK